MGKRILVRRHMLGLNQEELAMQAGITKQALSKIENGHNATKTDTLMKLAEILGVSGEFLYYGRAGEADLLQLYKKMDMMNEEEYRELKENAVWIADFIDRYKK